MDKTIFSKIEKLQEQYDELVGQKDSLYLEYSKIKKKLKEIDIVKENVDRILSVNRAAETSRQHEL